MNQSKTSHTMKWLAACSALAVVILVSISSQRAEACSRILYETGDGTYITGRSMDWNDPTVKTALWVFPEGMERDGGIGKNPVKWTSKYGSVVASFYDAGTADGMNEKGLVGNMLYLVETDYGNPAQTGKPTISVGAWGAVFPRQLYHGERSGRSHGRSAAPEHLHDAVAHRGGPGSESLLFRIGHHARGVLGRPEPGRLQTGLWSEEGRD